MIKVIFFAAAAMPFICQEQIRPEGWSQLDEQQQQAAKSGTITPSGAGTHSNVEAVALADPLRTTVGSLSVLALREEAVEGLALGTLTQDLSARELLLGPATDAAAVVGQLGAPLVKSAELTFDGGEINNAPMTNTVADGTGIATQINAALSPAKPSFSLASIINKLEDLILLNGAVDGVVVVNQAGNKVQLFTGTPAQVGAAFGAATGVLTDNFAGFTQDATAATSTTEFGE